MQVAWAYLLVVGNACLWVGRRLQTANWLDVLSKQDSLNDKTKLLNNSDME